MVTWASNVTAMTETLVTKTTATTAKAARECNSRDDQLLATDSSSFDKLVEQHRTQVGGLCYRLLGWNAEIEDVVQDVFLAVLKALPSFRGQSSISTWITRIAINACRAHSRKRSLRLRLFNRASRGREPPLERATAEGMLERERAARVRTAIRKLPVKYREVVVLKYLEELTVPEIAEVLDLNAGAIEVRLNRARKRMKKELAELWQG